MTFTDHFSIIDDAIGPQPWMQMRRVATEEFESVTKSYDPTDGWAKNDLLQTVTVAWTNNSPVSQWLYGMVSKTGSRVTLQCRSRGFLSTSHGAVIEGDPDNIIMTEVSRFGVGVDVGTGGLLAIGGAYGIAERRANSGSMPLLPQLTGDFLIGPGETFTAKVTVSFLSEFWENTSIDGGDGDTEATAVTGDLRIDLYATPAVPEVKPRGVPSIVGVSYDVEVDLGFADTRTSVTLPAGVLEGDILLAIVANQLGLATDIVPVEDGWTLLHVRNDGLAGIFNTHMKIFIRTATATEPAHYQFDNGILAEETAAIVVLRGTEPYVAGFPNWFIASNLGRDTLTCPTINGGGQLLLAASYFNHPLLQGAIDQTPPDGMTELLDVANPSTSLAIAFLDRPPTPTRERVFAPAEPPQYVGNTIGASILVPGARGWDDPGVTSNDFHWSKKKHTLFCVRGTFGRGTQALYFGNTLGSYEMMVAAGVDPDVWKVVDVHYPGDQLNPNAIFRIDQTSATGAANLIAMINQIPIGSKFAIAATSQGAAVASLVLKQIQSGSLTARAADLIGGVTFGNPMRQSGHTIPGGTNPPGHGVLTSNLLTSTPSSWWDFCNTGDYVSDVADDTLGQARQLVFQILQEDWSGIGSLNAQISAAYTAGFFTGVSVTLTQLFAIGASLLEIVILGLDLAVLANPVLNTSAHLRYHFPYTNLPGNTTLSAVDLAVAHLGVVAAANPLP